MGLFSRRRDVPAALPPGIVAMMERFGRFEFNPHASTETGSIWSETQAPLWPFASSDPVGFVGALRDAVIPIGGWAAFGGACTAWELLTADTRNGPGYEALLTGAVEFLRANGVPPIQVKGYLWSHWVDQGGTTETWIPRIPPPSAAASSITPLRRGELRRIAQLSPEVGSNVVLVRLDPAGTHVAVIDAPRSDEDPQRSRWDWQSAGSSHALYTTVGLALQVPPYWCDPELEPYFPIGRPLI